MSNIIEWEIPGLDDVKRVTEVGEHEQLIISPTLNSFHPFRLTLRGRQNPLKEDMPPVVGDVLHRVDFRNLPEVHGEHPWQIYFTVSGPGFDNNPMDLLLPSAFLCGAFAPDGHELTQRELIDLGEAVGLDIDVAYVRVDTKLLTPKRLQMIADRSVLPNGEPATGIIVRPEEKPTVALRLRNHNWKRKEDNAKD